MKSKLLTSCILLVCLVLVGCGNISKQEEERIFKMITEDPDLEKYITKKIESPLRLSKGDFNKELGVIEYTLFGDVTTRFSLLRDGTKHFIIKEIADKVSSGYLECSGKKSCKITSIMLSYYNEDDGLQTYHYSIKHDMFRINTELITDYQYID